ncbi:MAG: adenine phosphoribosyltransferase [Succinivibrio sp.]|nr:adenine phosphoribosyltransferase [Succinivibrio sp.]
MFDESKLAAYAADCAVIKESIASVPDFPKPGILFRDITSLCANPKAFALSVNLLENIFKDAHIDKIISAESRGFIFGAPLAARIGAGFVMVRKPGKLPRATIEESYTLEYGTNTLQINADAIRPGDKVLILDDLLATGGTVEAMIKLVGRLKGQVVATAFVIELMDLPGRKLIEDKYGLECVSLVKFPGH